MFHESTTGPFRRENTLYAEWSPEENDKVRCKLFGDISLISGFNEEKIDWSFLKLVSNSSFFISIAIKALTKRVLCLKYF